MLLKRSRVGTAHHLGQRHLQVVGDAYATRLTRLTTLSKMSRVGTAHHPGQRHLQVVGDAHPTGLTQSRSTDQAGRSNFWTSGAFMNSPRFVVLVWCFLLLWAEASLADVVSISDGSRLVGRVEQMADGRIVIVTEFAGRLEIDARKVTAITVDQPVNVQFASGDRLVGTIERSSEQDGVVMRTALGDIAVSPEQFTAIWPVGADSPEVAAVKEKAEQAKAALEPTWSIKLEAGGAFTEGNTDTLAGRGRFDLSRKTDDDWLRFHLAVRFAEQNDKRTENEYRGGVRYEHSLTPRWFWFTRTEMEFDEFENLDLRATAATGAGYHWWKTPERELKTRLGVGYRHESFDTGLTRDAAVFDLGLDCRLALASWAEFTSEGTYSPAFEDFDDYRLYFDTALVFPLKHEAWKLKLGMRNEYNSRPLREIERLDNMYYANIVLELE